MEANIEKATVNVLLTVNGELHLVGMSKKKLDAITMLIKLSTEAIVPTGVGQSEFNKFLKYDK